MAPPGVWLLGWTRGAGRPPRAPGRLSGAITNFHGAGGAVYLYLGLIFRSV
ncbi:hypothetical protein DICA3_C09340 [Diutina catenulata]